MSPLPLLALSLSFTAAVAVAAPDEQPEGAPEGIHQVMQRDWTAHAGPGQGDIQLHSPIYAMRFDQGCVMHRLTFLAAFGQPAMDQLVAETRYHAFAIGEQCAKVDPTHFFEIHTGSDTFGVMDFARRLKAGPQAGRDSVGKDIQARLAPCFTPEALRTTRITRAHSRRVGGAAREEFTVVLACDSLQGGEEITALGSYRDQSVQWRIGALNRVDDPPLGVLIGQLLSEHASGPVDPAVADAPIRKPGACDDSSCER